MLSWSNAQKSNEIVTPVFKDGESQIVEAFKKSADWIRHDLWVETTFDSDMDGRLDRMHVSVCRPKQTDTENLKLPVVYNTSPYFAGVAPDVQGIMWNVRHNLGDTTHGRVHPEVTRVGQRPIISNGHIKDWLPRGYIVVHSCSPGTGLSDGAPTVGGENESLAPKAVIDWLCGRAKGYSEREGGEAVEAYWSTGKVGMIGTSYNGTLPLAAACTGVEGLEAIIPIAPNTSYYHYYRSNGLVRSPGGYLGEDIDVLYDFIHSGKEANRASNNARVRDTEMKNGMDRITGDYNEFWKSRDYIHQVKNMKAALLMAHGFNDWNVMPEHSYRIYDKARTLGIPHQIYYHQNGHGGPPPMKMMNRWFTKYLHGIDNGVENDPKSWIVREQDKRSNPTSYTDYPHPDATHVNLYLDSGAPSFGKLSSARNEAAPNESLIDNFSFSGETLAKAEFTNHRLMYLSPTLNKDLHISGTPSIKLKMSSSAKSANLSVWLVSLPWNDGKKVKITDNIITRAWADPQNHKSMTESEDLVPGQFYELEFDFMPDDQIIKSGQQIGLMIFSSDRDFTLWPDPGTELTIELKASSLSLPVVGGQKSYLEAIE